MAERSSIGIFFNAGMVLALLAGGFLLIQSPIKSQRPQGNAGIEQERDGKKRLSRLWQDPFESARIMEKEREQNNKSLPRITSKPGTIEYALEQIKRSRKTPDDFPFNKIEDVFFELLWSNVLGSKEQSQFETRTIRFNEGKLRDTLSGVSVFAVMVPGKPYQDQAERRIRYRVALAHGLSEADYTPMDADRIGCFLFRTRSHNKKSGDLWENMRPLWRAEVQPEIPVPYEWFSQKDNDEKILVLWIDEDAFSVAPLMLLNLLRRSIDRSRVDFFCRRKQCSQNSEGKECSHLLHNRGTCDGCGRDDEYGGCKQCRNIEGEYVPCEEHALKLNVIGPYSSSTLSRIREEQRIYTPADNAEMTTAFENVFSCFPKKADSQTGSSSLLSFYNYSATNQGRPDARKPNPSLENEKFFRMHHLVSSDHMLMEAMERELALRNWSFRPKRDVILISEHDTEYGRRLPETFMELAEIPKEPATAAKDAAEKEYKYRFCLYSYLRGIDGTTAAEASAKEEKRLAGNTPSQSEKDIARVLNRWTQGKHTNPPLGNNQLDYIARLTMELKEKHSTPFAIGILGSDTYDKLMLLQSLRPVFPDTLFFTTDLDAQYLDVESVRTAHGLLIASSYGFSLHPNIQKNTPPFRGNYQTALFHAVRAAVANVDAESQAKNETEQFAGFINLQSEPRIFEIGWYNPVDLTMESTAEYKLFPGKGLSEIETPEKYYLITSSGKTMLHPLSPRVSPNYKLFFAKNTWKILLLVFCLAGFIVATGQTKLVDELRSGEWVNKISPKEVFSKDKDKRFRKSLVLWVWCPASIIIAIALAAILWNHFLPRFGGEPLSLLEGVSSWPLFLVHCCVAFLGFIFLLIATRNSQKVPVDVAKTVFPNDVEALSIDEKRKLIMNVRLYSLGAGLSKSLSLFQFLRTRRKDDTDPDPEKMRKEYIRKLFEPTSSQANESVWNQWTEYCGKSKSRFVATFGYCLAAFVFLLVFLALMLFLSNWTVLRGDGLCLGMIAVVSGMVASYLILNLLTGIVVADSIFNHQFISKISPKRSLLQKKDKTKGFSLETSEHFKVVRMIGEWTHITRNLVWLPTILLFVLTVARIGVIENFGRGETIRLCYGLVIALLIFLPVYKLYVEARKLRKELVNDMKNQMVELQSSEKKEPRIKPEQIKTVIEEMEKYQKGIYSPWLWHPMASAFLVLSGGISFPLLLDFFFR